MWDRRKSLRTGLVTLALILVAVAIVASVESANELDRIESQGWSPLFGAVADGDAESVANLLQRGASPNIAWPNGARPLHLAAQGGRPSVVRQLVVAGADVNARTKDGWTAAMVGAFRGHTEAVILILDAGGRLEPIGRTKESEIATAAVHEVAALAKESRRESILAGELYERAAVVYEGVAARYEKSGRELNDQIWKERSNFIASVLFGAFGNLHNQYAARNQARQFAEIRALKLAASRPAPAVRPTGDALIDSRRRLGYPVATYEGPASGYYRELPRLWLKYSRDGSVASPSSSIATPLPEDIDLSSETAVRDAYFLIAENARAAGTRCRVKAQCLATTPADAEPNCSNANPSKP